MSPANLFLPVLIVLNGAALLKNYHGEETISNLQKLQNQFNREG